VNAIAGAVLAALVLVVPARSVAGTVTVPLLLDHDFLRRLMIAQMYTAPGEEAELWTDENGCGHLTLRDPKVDTVEGKLRVRSPGDARWGAAVGETCVLPLSWHGTIEVFEDAVLDPQLPIVHFRTVDSNVYGKNGRKSIVTSRLWDWIKDYAHERMETVSVDLHRPLEEVRTMLPLVLPASFIRNADATLASVTLAGARVVDDGLEIDVAVAAPDAGANPVPEPPLDVEEIEQWDAFLTFVVKHAALDVSDPAVRNALLGVLLDSRYDIVEALMSAQPGDHDPVPALFRKAWERLAPVLRRLDDSLPGSAALRYLAFVAAGDALAAIEKLGPGTGLDISADGLRRLARIMAPDEPGDPLQYATAVDPELRESLGFGPPLPLPASPPPAELTAPGSPPSTVGGGAEPTGASTTTTTVPPAKNPTTTLPHGRTTTTRGGRTTTTHQRTTTTVAHTTTTIDRQTPTTMGGHAATGELRATNVLARLFRWLLPQAYAAEGPIEELRNRLRIGWAPTRAELDVYLPFIQRVLAEAAEDTLKKKPIPQPYAPMFDPLVLATAWKETCWRHFVRRGNKVVPIESHVGAIGIMQVNPRVWRGFYQVASLRADASYNARAGSEILEHYFVDYAIRKKEHEKGGGPDALARATYAAYNGGPGALTRYRSTKAAKRARAVDAEFWKVYQAARSGRPFDRKKCYGS
jgi:hypothetical protein